MIKASSNVIEFPVAELESETWRKAFAHVVTMRRGELRMSKAELAAKLGARTQEINDYEKGIREPKASRLSTMAFHLDWDAGELHGHIDARILEITRQAAE